MFDEEAIMRYQEGVAELQRKKKEQIEVADVRRRLHLKSIESCFEAEELAAQQDYESKKALLFDKLKEGIERKIGRVKDKLYDYEESKKLLGLHPVVSKKGNSKQRRLLYEPPRRRPKYARGPYIVYMLKDEEIEEDLKIIRKALQKREQSPEISEAVLKNNFSDLQDRKNPEMFENISRSNTTPLSEVKNIPKTNKFDHLQIPSIASLSAYDTSAIGGQRSLEENNHSPQVSCSKVDSNKKNSHTKLEYHNNKTSNTLINWSDVPLCSSTPRQNEPSSNCLSCGTPKLSPCPNIDKNLHESKDLIDLPSRTPSVLPVVPPYTNSNSRNDRNSCMHPMVDDTLDCSCCNHVGSEVVCTSDSQTISQIPCSNDSVGETFLSYKNRSEIMYYTDNHLVRRLCSTLPFSQSVHIISHQTNTEVVYFSECQQITVETSGCHEEELGWHSSSSPNANMLEPPRLLGVRTTPTLDGNSNEGSHVEMNKGSNIQKLCGCPNEMSCVSERSSSDLYPRNGQNS